MLSIPPQVEFTFEFKVDFDILNYIPFKGIFPLFASLP